MFLRSLEFDLQPFFDECRALDGFAIEQIVKRLRSGGFNLLDNFRLCDRTSAGATRCADIIVVRLGLAREREILPVTGGTTDSDR